MGKLLVESSVAESTETKDSQLIESYYEPELPKNILFPDQLNKYLRDQIQNLTLENGSLRRSLEEMHEELSSAKSKLSKTVLPITGRASEVAANKIAELSKKLREQNAELECLRTKVKEAEAKIRQLEARTEEVTVLPPTEDELSEKDKQIRILTEKLQAANTKTCDFRNQCQALKQELKLAQKVIENEVGEKVALQDLSKESGNWRGRAQQIITLQSKVQHLQEQISNTTLTDIPAANVLRQIEKERRATYEETTRQLNQKIIQLEETKKKLEAAKARNKVLENEIVQIKTKMTFQMEKSAQNEQLVTSLSNQINVYEDRGKAQMQCFNRMQENIYKLQHDIDAEKLKSETLQKALVERENQIHRLEEQVEELRKIKNFNREESSIILSEMESKNQASDQQDKKVFSIVDTERMRLLELLAVVNRRLDDSRREQAEIESYLRKEKFKNAKLETKIARLELERVGALRTGRGSYSQTNIKGGEPKLENADLMARQQIEYLEEECLALKTRIETLQMEKEDDLKVFAAMSDMRENLLDSKLTNRPPTKKVNSPREKRSIGKLTNRKPIRPSNKGKKFSPGRSTAGHSSFSSEESTM